MYLLYQVSGGKNEKGEITRQKVIKKTFEETGIDLKLRRLKFITHDLQYDCNVYAYKIVNVMLEQKEPNEMFAWCQYP